MALEVANRMLVRQGIEIGKHHRPVLGACALALAKKVRHRQRHQVRRSSTQMIRTEIVAGSEQRLSARRTQRTPQSSLRLIPAYSPPNGPRSTVTDTGLQETVPAPARSHARRCPLLKKVEWIRRIETYSDILQFPICSIYTIVNELLVCIRCNIRGSTLITLIARICRGG